MPPSSAIRSWRASGSPSRLTGTPASNPTMTSTRLGRGRPGQRVDVVGRRGPRILDRPALDGPAPQVLVDGVELLLGGRDGDLPLGRVARRSPHASMPHTRAGAKISRSGARARVPTSKRTWSLPLPVQPCATAVGPVATGLGHQMAHDHRARQRGDEGVLALVAGVGLRGPGTQNSSAISCAGVDHHRLDGSRRQGARPDGVPVLAALVGRLPDVDRHRDDLDALVLMSQRTATDVSSPPLYASTTRSAMFSPLPFPVSTRSLVSSRPADA